MWNLFYSTKNDSFRCSLRTIESCACKMCFVVYILPSCVCINTCQVKIVLFCLLTLKIFSLDLTLLFSPIYGSTELTFTPYGAKWNTSLIKWKYRYGTTQQTASPQIPTLFRAKSCEVWSEDWQALGILREE